MVIVYREIGTLIGINTPNRDNHHARVAVCLCLDTSGSMNGHPINELNAGVRLFYDAVERDSMASASAEIAIVTFGHEGVKCIQDFTTADNASTPVMTAGGQTPMGEAVNLALDMLEARKKQYIKSGIEYYQPWLVLMTDGKPYGGEKDELVRAKERSSQMVEDGKLTVFPIGIGNNADFSTLYDFSPKRRPVKLKGLNFRKFFEWLSASMHSVSVSKPDDKRIDIPDARLWAEEWGTL
ncbi:MAG: VWA domain-containing protein [Synergistaceae bacterium]|nr:VWA domain-containing protein [Synergistaceae bacterium]